VVPVTFGRVLVTDESPQETSNGSTRNRYNDDLFMSYPFMKQKACTLMQA
jgi:hypothetical protein